MYHQVVLLVVTYLGLPKVEPVFSPFPQIYGNHALKHVCVSVCVSGGGGGGEERERKRSCLFSVNTKLPFATTWCTKTSPKK